MYYRIQVRLHNDCRCLYSLRLYLSAAEGASCELVLSIIPSSFTLTMKSFTQTKESFLLAALAELTAELSRPFQTNILEQVADISFCGGAALLIGPLRQDIGPDILNLTTSG